MCNGHPAEDEFSGSKLLLASVGLSNMIAVTTTRPPDRSLSKLVLSVTFLLFSVGYFFVENSPRLVSGLYALLGVLGLLEYFSVRVRYVVRTQISNLAWVTLYAGLGVVLFWRYEYYSLAVGSLLVCALLFCGLFVRHVRRQ